MNTTMTKISMRTPTSIFSVNTKFWYLVFFGLFVKVNGNFQCKKFRKVCMVAEQPLSVASHLFLLRADMNGIPIGSYRDISNICWTILISSSMMLNECTKVFLGVAGMNCFHLHCIGSSSLFNAMTMFL